jgi:hypothetical protein
MKATKIILLTISVFGVVACNITKKRVKSIASVSIDSIPVVALQENTFLLKNPAVGIFAPGNEELVAIQLQYNDVTLKTLKEGHVIYTQGACVSCHGAKNIYSYQESQWKYIVDDMAQMVAISDVEKDAVYKYVLSIKATQPK